MSPWFYGESERNSTLSLCMLPFIAFLLSSTVCTITVFPWLLWTFRINQYFQWQKIPIDIYLIIEKMALLRSQQQKYLSLFVVFLAHVMLQRYLSVRLLFWCGWKVKNMRLILLSIVLPFNKFILFLYFIDLWCGCIMRLWIDWSRQPTKRGQKRIKKTGLCLNVLSIQRSFHPTFIPSNVLSHRIVFDLNIQRD